MLLRGVAHVVNYGRGIASETKQYYKEKKEAEAGVAGTSEAGDAAYLDNNEDEADWALDDAIDRDKFDEAEEGLPSYEAAPGDELLQSSITNEMAALENAHSEAFQVHSDIEKELPYPVILPQRM